MDLGLKGKRAVVTGSTAGIGLAAARGLAEEGALVTVNGRTAERVQAAVRTLEREVPGARVAGVAADLGRAEGCAALARQVPEVDILVNNVGIFEPKPFEEIPDQDWFRFFETNVMSGVRLTRHYLPGMRTDAAHAELEFFATARPSSILRRFATPDEVAALIVYLCGTKASATTGAALRVDGGVVRAIP